MNLQHWIGFLFCVITFAQRNPVPPNISRSEYLERRYNLTHARKGKQAVKEAVNFLLGQEKAAAETGGASIARTIDTRRPKCKSAEDCPTCVVSLKAIIEEGVFQYRGDDAKPPYPSKCWSQSVRYHVAPECELEEEARGVVPVYKWRWTLQSAVDGYCLMPDPSPPVAAAAYLKRQNKPAGDVKQKNHGSSPTLLIDSTDTSSSTPTKMLNVVMAGLSFMGQPYQSLGCLYSDLVVGGAMSTVKKGGDLSLPVMDVKKDGGVCSAYAQDKIAMYHPKDLHPNYTIPTQHAESCSADHSFVIYKSPDPTLPAVKVCFIYLFNVFKNIQPGHPLPWYDNICEVLPLTVSICVIFATHIRFSRYLSYIFTPSHSSNFKWADIDIVLAIPPHDELRQWIINTGGVMANLGHVKVVGINKVYEGLMSNQLTAAYKKQGFNPLIRDDFLAKYKKCGPKGADVHYRLPGMTDYAVQAWFGMISSGLGVSEDDPRKITEGALNFWY